MKKGKRDINLFYLVMKTILGIPFCLYYRPKVLNKDFIPKEGPVILVGNHIHLYDQCLPIMAEKRIVHYMAKKEYFEGKFAWFFKLGGCIPVDRKIRDNSASRKALEVLKDGNVLGIFPEGTRNKTDDFLLPFKNGAVSLAQKTNATIVPFVITGKYKFLTGNLKCSFLKPFKVSKDEDINEVNEKLRNMMLNELKINK